MQHRQERVEQIIRQVVAEIVVNELADPKIGFVTVTRCKVTRDLKIATVYVSILGDEKQREQGLEHLRHARTWVRRQLAAQVNLRYVPELRFAHDEILAHERHVNEILDQIKPEPAGPEDEPGGTAGSPATG